MDTIKTYIENVFTSFPQTERVQALKLEMLDSMEEKYQALKQEGKSEHEVIGSVISNFGSIDEIAAELGIEHNTVDPENSMYVSSEDAVAYMAQTKKSSVGIGIGVWIILTGVSSLLLMNGLDGIRHWNRSINAGSIVVMVLAVVAAVAVFIVSGISLYRYESFSANSLLLDARTRRELEHQNTRFMSRFAVQIAIGVSVLVLVAGASALLFYTAIRDVRITPFALLVFAIGPALLPVINAGMTKSAYDCLLGKGHYKYKVINKKTERIVGTIASVYWPMVVALYLLWSFLSGNWHISWIIWPVAGVVFGALSGGISTWQGMKE